MSADAPAISPRALYDRLRGDDTVSILDVRDRDEFEEWHIDGPAVTARQSPYVQFVAAQASGDPTSLVPDDLPEPIVAVCGVGEASGDTAAMLQESDVNAVNLEGGMDAWADLVVTHQLDGASGDVDGFGELEGLDIDVLQYERPATGCLSYLLVSDGEAILIDPLRALVERYIEDIEDRNLDFRYVLDTHVHADHLSGGRELAEQTGADYVLPGGARERGLEFDATFVDDGDSLDVGGAGIEVVATPGHTTEHVAFDAGAVLFTGDTLFLDGVGRPDLEAADQAREHASALYDTLHDVMFAYPPETLAAPGHVQPGDISTQGPYVESLEDVRARVTIADLDRESFVSRVAENLPPRPANHDRIVDANLGRSLIDEAAMALELGPNNCAIPGG